MDWDWEDHGFVVKRGFFDEHVIDAFLDFYQKQYLDTGQKPRDNDYLRYLSVRDLLCHKSLNDVWADLQIEAGVEACLLWWEMEPTGWHLDRLYHPTRSAGIWIALDDIPEESGRFEIMPGSNHWKFEREKCMPLGGGGTNDYVQSVLDQHDCEVYAFDGHKGDLLVWHPDAIHRRAPGQPGVPRKAAVALCNEMGLVRHGLDGAWFQP